MGVELTFLRFLLARGDNSSGSWMYCIMEAKSGMWQMRHPGFWKLLWAFQRNNAHNSLRTAPSKPKQMPATGGNDKRSRGLGIRVRLLGSGSCSDLHVVSEYFSIRCFLSTEGKIDSTLTKWSKLTPPIIGHILMSRSSRYDALRGIPHHFCGVPVDITWHGSNVTNPSWRTFYTVTVKVPKHEAGRRDFSSSQRLERGN